MSMDYSLNNLPFLVSSTAHSIVIRVYVQPNAKKTECTGVYTNALRVRLTARAVENKANKALLIWIAEYFEVKQNKVTLLSGEHSRTKYISIDGDSASLLIKCYSIQNKEE